MQRPPDCQEPANEQSACARINHQPNEYVCGGGWEMRDILFAMNLQEFFLKQKEAVRSRTRQVVGMLRPEQMAWRPEKDALTIGEMVRHLWVSEEGVRRAAL